MSSKLKNSYKQYGWKNFFVRVIKGFFRRIGIIYEVFYIYERSLLSGEIKPSVFEKDFHLKIIDKSNIDDLNSLDIDLKKSKERINNNYQAFCVFHNEVLAYLSWISIDIMELPFENKEKKINLENNEGLLVGAYCKPEYRGYNLHSMINNERLIVLKKLGKSKALGIVLKENYPAIRVQLKSGLEHKRTIVYWNIFSKEIIKIFNNKDA